MSRGRRAGGEPAPGAVADVATRWRERWEVLCDWLGLGIPGLAAGDRLLARHCEGHRVYHGAGHVLYCLELLDTYPATMGDADAVELALWFHDAVYARGAAPGENEAASAAVFEVEFAPLAGRRVQPATVRRLILATAHRDLPADGDEALVCDIDLAVLGAEPPRYAQYAADVRREYGHVPDDLFRDARSRLLKTFLSRKRIFATPHFYKLAEARARDNVRRELDDLLG